ncbi:MAG: 3-hydroxyacyl-CoA dehydrogenase family protein [Chloroflexi bacterium]|nr:3-hydroxyacyl-CoA dehydrogenase family protein [Chloroflexota bacterium]
MMMAKAEGIDRVAVVGAGLMGHGIAQVFTQAGYLVTLQDVRPDLVETAVDSVASNLALFVRNEILTPELARAATARLSATIDLTEAVEQADLVIEAIYEDIALKQKLFQDLDQLTPAHAILASNSSCLSIEDMASVTSRPDRVVAMHFWNPPHVLPLVEIAPASRTSQQTVETVRRILAAAGKKPVLLRRDTPGYIGNRLQFALVREAISIVEQGIADPEEVDIALKTGFGRRLGVTGVFQTADLGGLDLFLAISRFLLPKLENSPTPPPLLEQKVRDGEFGVKSGKGFYDWTPETIAAVKEARDKELLRYLKRDLAEDGETLPGS